MLRFWGASDDLAECDGDISGEMGCFDDFVVAEVGEPEAGVQVLLTYCTPDLPGGACWGALVRQLDEDIPIPWPVRIETVDRNGEPGLAYSVGVVIDCPPGTPVRWRRGSEPDGWEEPA